MKLIDLPVVPNVGGSNYIDKVYVEERNTINTEEELLKFTERWKALWYLKGDKEMLQEELDIVNSKYDPVEVLECLKKNRVGGVCDHVGKEGCVGMHITVPISLMLATMVSNHFGVSVDIALVQANGGIGVLYED